MDPFLDLEENFGLGNYKRLNDLKKKNPDLKTLIAIGGWNEGSTKYSLMAGSKKSRKQFVHSVVRFLEKHGFDGLEVDWEYPTKRGGHGRDRKKFVLLLRDLRKEFDQHDLILSAAVSAGKEIVDQAYDVPKLNKYLHFLNLMTYDFFGPWDSTLAHNSPLFHRPNQHETSSIDFIVNYWIKKGILPSKLLLGLPFYGRSFTLHNPQRTEPFAPSAGPGRAGLATGEEGYLSYYEVCLIQKSGKATTRRDDYWLSPYLFFDDQWIGFDDVSSIRTKVEYARNLNLGGVMIWSLDNDDFRGYCGQGNSPLVYTVVDAMYSPMNGSSGPVQPIYNYRDESESDNLVRFTGTDSSPFGPSVGTSSVDTSSVGTSVESVLTSGFKCKAEGMFRDPKDCRRFYHCFKRGPDGWTAAAKMCQPNTVFSEDWQICVWPHQTNCEDTNLLIN